jgi:hypothetical protein
VEYFNGLLENYLAAFKNVTARKSYLYQAAEPVIREIAAELDREAAEQTAKAANDAEKMTLARRLLDAAILLLSEPANAGAVETRGSK